MQRYRLRPALAAIGAACLLGACASPTPPASQAAAPSMALMAPVQPEAVGEIRAGSGILRGYLERKDLPGSLRLLPPPPAAGSAAALADEAAYRQTRPLLATARGKLAADDAVLRFPKAAETFSCALGVDINSTATPNLVMLLRRSLTDAGLATYQAKDHYQRPRPFVQNREGSCTPGEEAALAKDGSYPSGHAALGWAWGLVLTQVAPERTDALLQRGYAFGQSRVICGVHWQSDVDAGRVVGAAAVARLQSDAMFQAQLRAATNELKAQQAAGRGPVRDCVAEAAALQ